MASNGTGTVIKITPGGGQSTYATGLNGAYGLAFDSSGNLYVANEGIGTVTEIPPGGGTGSTFATGLVNPTGLAFDSSGNLYIGDAGNNTVAGSARAAAP